MTAADGSLIGIAKQLAKGTPITVDASFDYLLFREGGVSPNNLFLPLDREIGGGAMQRNVIKVGVFSGGRLSIIPRPKTLGHHFLGLTGDVASVDNSDGSYTHTFTISDQFAAPWYTLRSAPGNLWGEQLPDVRYAGLNLAWRGGRFVEGEVAFQGAGVPSKVSTAAWGAAALVDGGPQFIAPLGAIELPTGTPAVVNAGTFTCGIAMPLDEQWVVGSYSPHAMDIVQRSHALSLMLKIADADLYTKMAYDPQNGSAWVAEVMREANIALSFQSDIEAATGVPYEFTIAANGQSGADANVVWSVRPINLRAGSQVTMVVTGTFLADPGGSTPITLTLTNQQASY